MKGKKGGSLPTVKTLPNPSDEELLQQFLDYYGSIKQLKTGSRKKHLYALRQVLGWIAEIGATIPTLNEKAVLQLIKRLQTCGWSEDTREDYWQRFCILYKWSYKRSGQAWDQKAHDLLCGEDRYIYRVDANKIQRKGVLSPQEVLSLVHTEPDLCYKTFFAVLYEGGLRAGEALSLQVRDVHKGTNGGYVLQLRTSKTDRRPVPLLNFSVSYLERWLKAHPQGKNGAAPLFLNSMGQSLTDFAANKHLKYLLQVTGIKTEKVSLHSFRHSRATELAGVLNEFQMCKLFGWQIGSEMPRTYIREKNIDVESSLRRAYGMEAEEKPKQIGRPCLHCEHMNPSEAEICDICRMPLDGAKLQELKTRTDAHKMEDLVKNLLRDKYKDLIEDVRKELKAEVRGGGA